MKVKSAFNISILESTPASIPLLSQKESCLYIFRRGKIIKLKRRKKIAAYHIPYGFFERIFVKIGLTRRILRLDITDMVCLSDNSLVAISRKAILFKAQNESSFKIVHQVERGSRPLNICQHPDGNLYWGEYFGNSNRDEVHIYGSTNGTDWEICYTFPKNSIRHVHGIYWDSFREGLWVLTGDDDHESGLWFTKDAFKTLTCVVSGSQKARAVSIIPLKNRIIVPTDTPREVNFIQSFNPKTNKFFNLKKISGSAFHCFADESIFLVTTVVEPSIINQSKNVEVWASIDATEWKLIANLKQDFWSSLSYKFFRYPEVLIAKETPSENNPNCYLYCRGVQGFSNTMITLEKQKIKQYLELE